MALYNEVSVINTILALWVLPPVSTVAQTKKSQMLHSELPKAILHTQQNGLQWKFLTTTVTLDSPTTPNLSPLYQYTFTLPPDCLKVISGYWQTKYFVKGKFLLTNSPTITITYIAYSFDYSQFPPHYIKYISLYLANLLTLSNTGQPSIAADVKAKWEEAETEAMATELQLNCWEDAGYAEPVLQRRYY